MTSPMNPPALDAGKLKELILYIAAASREDDRFGAVKLNKILYWADFEAYRRLGAPITGAEYQHLPEGPAPRRLLPARSALEDEGALVIEERPFHGYVQYVPTVRRNADLTIFSPEEIALVDEVIAMLRPYNGADVSELSHREWGWKLSSDGETIHYATAWFSPVPLSQLQSERAQEIAARREVV